ncbi:MAG: TonB-dependent receptor [Rhizomicrobium sp.]
MRLGEGVELAPSTRPLAQRRALLIGAMLAATLSIITDRSAQAQRASENAVTQADDAFGTTIGNEKIGIYDEDDVRGFSPLQAGNARIDGLYFDKVGDENDRIQESSRIRVGIAAQGYAFPAPTGIVDFALRIPGDVSGLSVLAEGSSFGYSTLQLDGVLPLDKTLSMGGGIGYNRNRSASGGDNYEGNIGVILRWRPHPNLEFLPFWSRKDTYAAKDGEAYEPEGDFLPSPMPQHHFFGPPWARGQDFSINYGGLLGYSFSSWVVRLGIFRSELTNPKSSFPHLSDLTPSGHGELKVDLSPPSHLGSTSGEMRLEKTFDEGPWVHRLIFSLRGRNWNGLYGNSVTVDAGPQTINQVINSPKPSIQFASLTHDHVDESFIGFGYQAAWKSRLQISVGAQRVRYHKRTIVPGNAPTSLNATPWLLTGAATGNLTDDVAIFGSFAQGLEESGIAPSNAVNSNQALPAVTTRQKEGGIRWKLLPDVSLVASIFDLKKLYFNLDSSKVFRELGELENKGLELSLSGKLTDQVNLVAGAVLSEPTVGGEAVRLGITGDKPVGIRSRKFIFDANWSPHEWTDLSFDLGVNHYGSVPATLNGATIIPGFTTIDWDSRYEFKMAGQVASLKFAIMNMFNVRAFRVLDANTYGFFPNSGRRIDLRLIVDL